MSSSSVPSLLVVLCAKQSERVRFFEMFFRRWMVKEMEVLRIAYFSREVQLFFLNL